MKYLILMLILVIPVGMVYADQGCPNGFERTAEWDSPHNNPDKNGDGFVCEKELPNGKTIYKDNFGIRYVSEPR